MDDDKYFDFLREQAKLIRQQSFDVHQVEYVFKRLADLNKIFLTYYKEKNFKDPNKAFEVTFEFSLACQIAYSNYRKENKTMWSYIFGSIGGKLKLPDMNLK